MAAGKICAIASITPTGVNAVVTGGWSFRRDAWSHAFDDGVKDPNFFDANWRDDTSIADFTMLIPDSGDKIYDIDGPNVGAVGNTNDTQTYDNFREYVQWNPTPQEFFGRKPTASDYGTWYWQGRWQAAKMPQITLMDVGTGSIPLPDKPAP